MNELSLFTGAGGGLLGTYLLGWRTVGAVEWESYPCRVLEQRQRDGILPAFPIWNMDIREFNQRIAERYRGVATVISAGFPCQPFSLAGKRDGADDERNMWPATIDAIRIIQPRCALLENVPGLLSSGYFGQILGDLVESGYGCRWRILSAAELGAPHKRDRLWIVAHAECGGCTRRAGVQRARWRAELAYSSKDVADANSGDANWRSSPVQMGRGGGQGKAKANGYASRIQWGAEPDVGRVAHGVAARVDRLNAVGNGQVPAVVRAAWELLSR